MGSWENAACVGNSNSRQLGPHLANLWVEIERITEEWGKKKKSYHLSLEHQFKTWFVYLLIQKAQLILPSQA